jgi:hypothetical protein
MIGEQKQINNFPSFSLSFLMLFTSQLSTCKKRTRFLYKKTFSGGTLFEERNVAHDCVSNDLELPASSPPPPLIFVFMVYTVKKVSDFNFPSRDVTNQTLHGREL